ncbi:hypothetical protein CRE_20065 [Caenorhabditis remanei]|uniref:Uncharacterized protein n=1 Tax=Caenorhabditis remanei TaxID=31234 RepID=E3NIV6_CAERE|nr:hypothetical protein CRE_20065 [Caenorhabditis remanei]
MDECDSGNSASSGNHHYHGGLGGNGDIGAVYGIPQQRRVWQKPRGPDTSSDEYAKSVSSREFVSEIVCKTKRSPVKNQSNDSLYQLPESVVSETMKVAKNLLASHKNLTFDLNAEKQRVQQKTPQYYSQTHYGTGDHAHRLPDFSVPPPPLMTPQPLIAPTPSQMYNQQYPHQMETYQMCYYYPPRNYPSTSSSYPSASNSYLY